MNSCLNITEGVIRLHVSGTIWSVKYEINFLYRNGIVKPRKTRNDMNRNFQNGNPKVVMRL